MFIKRAKYLLTDSFENFLIALFIVIVVGNAYLITRAIQSIVLIKNIYYAKKSEKDIKVGDIIAVEGKPILNLEQLNEDRRNIIYKAWSAYRNLANSIYLKIVWKHQFGFGRRKKVIIDRIEEFLVPFYLETKDNKIYKLKQKLNFDFYIVKSISRTNTSALSEFSYKSSWVDIDYFSSDIVYLIGKVDEIKENEIILAPLDKDKYFLSNEPFSKIYVGHASSVIATFVLILFSICICFILRFEKIKENIENNELYIVFDKMGGNETIVFIIGILWFILYIPAYIYLDPIYPYQFDFLNAMWGLGIIAVYLIGQNVEWFYVYNSKDGFLYTASRGLLGQAFEKVAYIKNAKVFIDSRTYKNTTYYKLVADLSDVSINLTEETTNHSAVAALLGEFEKKRTKRTTQ